MKKNPIECRLQNLAGRKQLWKNLGSIEKGATWNGKYPRRSARWSQYEIRERWVQITPSRRTTVILKISSSDDKTNSSEFKDEFNTSTNAKNQVSMRKCLEYQSLALFWR